jgi:signal transduction histidine kinase
MSNQQSDTSILEAKIKSEQQKFEAIFYGSESPMVIFKGPDMVVEMFNEKYQEIYKNRNILGESLFKAIPELVNTPFPGILKKVYETGEYFVSREGHSQLYNAVTEQFEDRYFDTTFARISFGDELYRILATPREVTQRVLVRKKLEDSLKELEEERELRERFVLALSHDLRTPLAIVTMCALILKRKVEDSETIIEMADRITSSVARADRMIRDLLDANRIKAGLGIPISLEECSLDQILTFVISDLEELYGKRFVVHNLVGEIKGHWDTLGIHRIVENLASNAIKYGTPYSTITVTLALVNKCAEISVHNTGSFIPVEEQDSLFDHYSRSKSAESSGQTGWGIGLALVKGLTEAHKGSVHMKSDVDSGTTFTVILPIG